MHKRKARSIMKKTNQELLNLYFQSRASDAEVAELEKRMLADSDLRELYLQEAILETNLNSIALREDDLTTKPEAKPERISSKILPNSDIKFFFKCKLSIAAQRRHAELKKLDPFVKLIDVKKALRIRNLLDTTRKHSPLLKHRNSVEIDTGKLNKRAMVKKMSKTVEKYLF